MKVFIQSPDDQSRINGVIHNFILSYFPHQVSSPEYADVCLIPVSFYPDYKVNPKLFEIQIPTVVLDFMEYEWCYFNESQTTHFFGKNTAECRWLNPNWYALDAWLNEHPPIMYFKRELLATDASDTVKPIEWPCYLEERPIQSEDEFNVRQLEVLNIWGYSHPSRPKLHGSIFHGMATHQLGVVASTEQFEGHFSKHPHARTWMTVFTPWHTRKPMSDLRWYQERAKISVSLYGCGIKCFRHAESPVSSIMALQDDNLAWSFPWIGGENCIRLRLGHEFEDLEKATRLPDLYSIYKQSHETIDRYRSKRYVEEYIIPTISNGL